MATPEQVNAMPLEEFVAVLVAAAPPLPDEARAKVRPIWSAAWQATQRADTSDAAQERAA